MQANRLATSWISGLISSYPISSLCPFSCLLPSSQERNTLHATWLLGRYVHMHLRPFSVMNGKEEEERHDHLGSFYCHFTVLSLSPPSPPLSIRTAPIMLQLVHLTCPFYTFTEHFFRNASPLMLPYTSSSRSPHSASKTTVSSSTTTPLTRLF